MVENIATRVFGEKKERPAIPTNLRELKVRGNFEGAPIIPLLALESYYISNKGPFIKTKFTEELWLKDNQLAVDRFDKIPSDEKSQPASSLAWTKLTLSWKTKLQSMRITGIQITTRTHYTRSITGKSLKTK